MFPIKNIVDKLKSSLFLKQQIEVEVECRNKPKLRTFILFKDFQNIPAYIFKPLSFLQRKIISKARLGILPIRLETARYLRPPLPEDQRLCYCDSGEVESEIHILFSCYKYDSLRQSWLTKLSLPDNFLLLNINDRLKLVLNEPANVKYTAQFIVDILDLRRLINIQY